MGFVLKRVAALRKSIFESIFWKKDDHNGRDTIDLERHFVWTASSESLAFVFYLKYYFIPLLNWWCLYRNDGHLYLCEEGKRCLSF